MLVAAFCGDELPICAKAGWRLKLSVLTRVIRGQTLHSTTCEVLATALRSTGTRELLHEPPNKLRVSRDLTAEAAVLDAAWASA